MGNNRKKELTENDLIKLEIAKEIGLLDKIDELGWGGLTAKESGRIGGIMTAKKRKGKKIDDEAKLL
ncbi:small, acid-soluble spore protein, alpha/beta type [Sedimentibacter sp. zth1]|uniref:small, acid-soluble spore protein, alpha/beta type n=1 Tax=Sedimentibacter sp. zth1 TaxID=2816908 RepID=UPI001A912B95|nr:small, acid-soluble spore protein, alpha/beta type [Sedimentibacter sp. zth1]QSX07128.1 small, acid-soluble spore protein, alpha/beta type [Sedimentibacter sp. zth1]